MRVAVIHQNMYRNWVCTIFDNVEDQCDQRDNIILKLEECYKVENVIMVEVPDNFRPMITDSNGDEIACCFEHL